MSGPVTTIDVSVAKPGKASATLRRWGRKLDGLLERAGDRLNPILVKETRQALKSRQFLAAFGLMLTASWLWSVFGLLGMMGTGRHAVGCGDEMFIGYCFILGFPLLVIVPFGAYRGLAAEREENTYELLSITAMGPRQLVAGKLAAAMTQMMIYLSAVAPCVAFCYMLRGLDLPTIAFVLAITVAASAGFSMIGLLAATTVRGKAHQTILTVMLTVGLFLAFWGGCALVFEILDSPYPFLDDREFWIGAAAAATAYVSYFVLVFEGAVAQLGFAADNRSTRLRIVMLAQHVLLAAWIGWSLLAYRDSEIVLAFITILGLHWYAMGAAMIGESPRMSWRVMRGLPKSFLGRMFLSWFNPGPCSGYVFALCGLLGGFVTLALGLAIGSLVLGDSSGATQRLARWQRYNDAIPLFCFLTIAYVTIFLGVGLLVMRAVGRRVHLGIVGSVFLQICFVVGGCVGPAILDMLVSGGRVGGYSLLHVSNPFWTIAEAIDGRGGFPSGDTVGLVALLVAAAVIVFALNFRALVAEIRQVRVVKPDRVRQDDADLAPPPPPPPPKRTNPWAEGP